MQSTPDLAGIVNLIMQNPALIEQIAALAKQKTVAPPPEEAEGTEAPPVEEVAVNPSPAATAMRTHRHELLSAMKPYLSENRRVAIDSMASILDVIDVVIKK